MNPNRELISKPNILKEYNWSEPYFTYLVSKYPNILISPKQFKYYKFSVQDLFDKAILDRVSLPNKFTKKNDGGKVKTNQGSMHQV